MMTLMVVLLGVVQVAIVVVMVLRECGLTRRLNVAERRTDDLTERAVAHGQALRDLRDAWAGEDAARQALIGRVAEEYALANTHKAAVRFIGRQSKPKRKGGR